MKIEPMPLTLLLSMVHQRNPKLHRHLDIADSFERFGFVHPVTIDEATQIVVAGHGRLETLSMMRDEGRAAPDGVVEDENSGEWMVPTIRGVSFATEQERDAYLLADNQLSIGGGWNEDALSEMLRELADNDGSFMGLGFDDDALANMLPKDEDEEEPGDDAEEDSGRDVNVEGHTRTIGGHKVRPPIQMTQADWTLHLGDCIAGMREKIEDASVDAVVTDPPAGISFMGKGWDDDKGGRDHWIAWLQEVMTEAFRALKPGGHLLAWALPRTSHWTAFAIENAGFEIRDVVYHAFGTGYPKNHDVSKAIDAKLGVEREVVGEQVAFNKLPLSDMNQRETAPLRGGPATPEAAKWDGWGTALKPAVEPWILARKPLDGTIAENVLKHGVGGINIDDCRVGSEERFNPSASSMCSLGEKPMDDAGGTTARGRWPAHLVLSHSEGCKAVGTREDTRLVNVGERIGDGSRSLEFGMGKMETAEATTTITKYECVPDCAVRMLDEQGPVAKPKAGRVQEHRGSFGIINDDGWEPHGSSYVPPDEGGGISRFFYVAKPSKAETEAGLGDLPERSGGELTDRTDGSKGLDNPRAGAGRGGGRRNIHPTKKPIELMRLLVRLITPQGGLVLDPFTGSGTTGLASLVEGCRFVGFEMSADYHAIASARMRTIIDDPRTVEEADATPE